MNLMAKDEMEVNGNTKVGELAARHPQTTRVFARHGLDFCCGGGRPLSEACSEGKLELDVVIADIHAVLAADDDVRNWSEAPLEEIIDHILQTFHEPLREELPRLVSMAHRVNQVHGAKDPERFEALLSTLRALKSELSEHMMKEEQILFPMIRRGQGSLAAGPVSVMEHEHESAGSALRQLRDLTSDYTAPQEACTTWQALWHGLEDLEHEMHDHIHLENNVLFPRALGQVVTTDRSAD